MQLLRPAVLAATLTALALLGGPPAAQAGAGNVGSGPVVRCEPCDARALAQCAPPPTSAECAELVREPGCGCCLTCALREGQPCGVYTERCGAGLRCHPQPGEPRPLLALLDGRGVCTNASATGRLSAYLLPAPGNGSESEEDHGTGAAGSPALPGTHRAPDPKFHTGHTKMDVIRKGHAKDSQRYKVDYEAQNTDTQNFSSESKRETEYGPCRREMEDTLKHLKFLNMLSPRGVHIPNCDKKGFYKKKQCRPSKGRKRGFCWCVDKYGQPLPGYGVKGKGDVQCDSVESK
ncbi:insulin-like growth factor-binding protein 3 isoform X2 [Pteronotus mesoamericanus]|uniref:insulin-like growth factor-binding protein 3 isoform X2 n=1 Tax=Pteronotus mesoamericanus TaxID=1884717 RepID=UPI0023ED7807|nr:insulin-like growth factor-binding protein 3 isoform X2 [Pteronotus parnellii mesoamericanus]